MYLKLVPNLENSLRFAASESTTVLAQDLPWLKRIVLADISAKRLREVIKKLMELGLMVTINQAIDAEAAALVAADFGYEVEKTGLEIEDLKEEKERGITIELGFTSMALPSGSEISIVDVPGHEKFVRHMVAGATGIDLAGEAPGRLKLPGDTDWFEAELGTNSFGQGIAVTPIQMVMAISSVANGKGEMMLPHVMRSMVRDGYQYDPTPQVIGRPISGETAQTLTELLARSLEGESSDALIDGYRVAGKTGTADTSSGSTGTSMQRAGW
jgi:cell division protein FtsI/penicillin-binding protein 2